MKNPALPMLLFAATLVVACGNKHDASEENFAAAVNQYLDKHGDLCLTLLQWPTDIPVEKIEVSKVMKRDSPAKYLDALVAAGLASESDIVVDQLRYDGKPNGHAYNVKRYVLSEIGRRYYREQSTSAVGGSPEVGDLCFGKAALDKIVKWDTPMNLRGPQQEQVTYTYKIDNLAEWAMNPAVQKAYLGLQYTIANAGKQQKTHDLTLTNNGWEANGL
ncbi:hypothetical protein [Cupriavidus consociatus]|uniref:hypothetical protein n=1 Tax=Cupriavidus consociatus TaxID=2821357 RepID=UPI001AE77026|nr:MULTISPECIES: hypothetical protein [unclassified Cupriavidus]MBP0625420.1 hypothetical protein [Cupriavidus sp. LEh25]MDK2662161.1 hypothetical protein [Cupriavidus sp. LEh21]